MKAILIDVSCRCLQMVDVGFDMHQVYKTLRCSHITAVYPLPGAFSTDLFYVDDRALSKPLTKDTGAFFLGQPKLPIFGNALVVGCDRKGLRTEPLLTLSELSDKIQFLERDEIILYHTMMERDEPKIFYW
jgi:hypothetical protein